MFVVEIPGNPVPQKQTRFANGFAYDPSKKDRERIQWQMKPFAPHEPISSAVVVHIWFFFPVPKSCSKVSKDRMIQGLIQHVKRPDADNCAYIVTNSMKGIFIVDDSQIVDLFIHKRFSEVPKTKVIIYPVTRVYPEEAFVA